MSLFCPELSPCACFRQTMRDRGSSESLHARWRAELAGALTVSKGEVRDGRGGKGGGIM